MQLRARARSGWACSSTPRRRGGEGNGRWPGRLDQVTGERRWRSRVPVMRGCVARADRRTRCLFRPDGCWKQRSPQLEARGAALEPGDPDTPCSPSTRRGRERRSSRHSLSTPEGARAGRRHPTRSPGSRSRRLGQSRACPRSWFGASVPTPDRSSPARGPRLHSLRWQRRRATGRVRPRHAQRTRSMRAHRRHRTRSRRPVRPQRGSRRPRPPAGRGAARRARRSCLRARRPSLSRARCPRSRR